MEKVGFLFAGQGSQYPGMGKDLYEAFSQSRQVFEQANEVLGFDLRKICFEGSPEQLKATAVSQPAIVTVTIAAFEAFKVKHSLKPAYAAGLSLGEYSALIAMGAFSFKNGLKLVQERGRIMDAATKKYPGKMAAVLDLSLEEVMIICRKTQAEIANLNCPGQIVISGASAAVEAAMAACKAAGAKRVIELEVSGGFHSPLMFEASGQLKQVLDDTPVGIPKAAVISNYTASPMFKSAQIRQNLVYQIYSAVKWEESMRFMLAQGVVKFYEFGPGKVLRGLLRKIDSQAEVVNIEKAADI